MNASGLVKERDGMEMIVDFGMSESGMLRVVAEEELAIQTPDVEPLGIASALYACTVRSRGKGEGKYRELES